MGYKTITSFVANEVELGKTLPPTRQIAEIYDGHLTVCALGIDMTPAGGFYMGASPILLQETLTRAQKSAEALEASIQAQLSNDTVLWSSDSAIIQFGSLPALIGVRARFSDLVVQTCPYGPEAHPAQEAAIEAALFEGQTAVLMVPSAVLPSDFGKRVMIAWNQSNEALSAVRKALPLLQAAEMVSVVIVDPPVHSPERSDPGGALTQMLARHGVRAEVAVLAKTMPQVSDVLLRHMVDMDASVMVMGAYGHSRLRESLLGGATRNILEHAERAVFLAH